MRPNACFWSVFGQFFLPGSQLMRSHQFGENGVHMLRLNAYNKNLSRKGEACELDNFITEQLSQKGEITNST
jgi:hypothetical protein